jgi:hypothetical protein
MSDINTGQSIIPVKAGIHHLTSRPDKTGIAWPNTQVINSGLRRNDEANGVG